VKQNCCQRRARKKALKNQKSEVQNRKLPEAKQKRKIGTYTNDGKKLHFPEAL